MINFKLPGSLKAKKILLVVLVAISIYIIINYATGNNKTSDNNTQKDAITATISASFNKEEVVATATPTATVVEEATSVAQTLSEEDTMYNDAYNDFFSGNYTSAINKANALIKKYPQSYRGYNILGIAQSYNGNFEDGVNNINKSLSIKPDYGYGLFNKALSYELFGYYDQALTFYDQALKVEQYLWSYYGKASIYGRRGDIQNVSVNLNSAFSLAKDEKEKSQVKEEAKNEADFDPVKNTKEFQNLVK